MEQVRRDGRAYSQMRKISVEYDVFGWATGSVLLSFGGTKILCAINIQNGVPPFLRGKGVGWVTAEYAMLPASTVVRTQREASTALRNGRSVEISRLIGRVLRSIVNTEVLGERTIFVDCDVLQADGGTRTASITAASLVLRRVQDRMLREGSIKMPFLRDDVCAVSVGVSLGHSILLDPDYAEDSELIADFNFVVTLSGDIIEIQGCAEKGPVSWQNFERMKNCALEGIKTMATLFTASGAALEGNKGLSHSDRISLSHHLRFKQQHS